MKKGVKGTPTLAQNRVSPVNSVELPQLQAVGPSSLLSSSSSAAHIYEAVLSSPLPVVNLSRTLLHSYFTPRVETFVLHVMGTHFQCIAVFYRVGFVALIVSFFQSGTAIDTCLMVIAAPACVSIVGTMLLLPLDLVALLMRSYEFWFVTAFNLLHWITLAYIWYDYRAFMCIPGFLGYEIAVLIDANIRLYRASMTTMVIGLPFLLLVGILVIVKQTEEIEHFQLALLDDRKIFDTVDVMALTTSTLTIFLVKIIVKKKVMIRRGFTADEDTTTGISTIIPCAVLKAKLRLTLANSSKMSKGGSKVEQFMRGIAVLSKSPSSTLQGVNRQNHHHIQQLTLSQRRVHRLDASNTVIPARFWRNPPRCVTKHPLIARYILYTIGLTGYALLIFEALAGAIHVTTLRQASGSDAHVIVESESDPQLALYAGLAFAGFTCTVVFCCSFVIFYQRDLLRAVVTQFDFLFFSLQIIIFCLCMCDRAQWSVYHCMLIWAWVIWFHWAITLDALTPVIKSRVLHFGKRMAAIIIATVVGSSLLVVYEVASISNGSFGYSRTLFRYEVSSSRALEIRTDTVLLGRVITMFMWSSRQVYLLLTRREDELNLIHGVVEYQSPYETFPLRRTVSSVPASVTPILERNAVTVPAAMSCSIPGKGVPVGT